MDIKQFREMAIDTRRYSMAEVEKAFGELIDRYQGHLRAIVIAIAILYRNRNRDQTTELLERILLDVLRKHQKLWEAFKIAILPSSRVADEYLLLLLAAIEKDESKSCYQSAIAIIQELRPRLLERITRGTSEQLDILLKSSGDETK